MHRLFLVIGLIVIGSVAMAMRDEAEGVTRHLLAVVFFLCLAIAIFVGRKKPA